MKSPHFFTYQRYFYKRFLAIDNSESLKNLFLFLYNRLFLFLCDCFLKLGWLFLLYRHFGYLYQKITF